jgi:hypothetical protein
MKTATRVLDHPDRDSKIIQITIEVSATEMHEAGAVMGRLIDDRSPYGVCLAMVSLCLRCVEGTPEQRNELMNTATALLLKRADSIRNKASMMFGRMSDGR